MLHIFHLDAGHMILFDVNYASGTVQRLKDAISQALQAPSSDQILLISGGEVLECSRKVACYGAGTDASNPIFLICKCDLTTRQASGAGNYRETFIEPQMSRDLEAVMARQQKASTSSVSYQTIQNNAQVAKKFVTASDEHVTYCCRLVNEQHLMHQGWCAVTANLEDTTRAFTHRVCKFKERHEKFLAQKQRAVELLNNFANDLQILKRIPLLNCLLEGPSAAATPIGDDVAKAVSEMSLFEWISSKEPESSLRDLIMDVQKCLDEAADPKIAENLTHWERVTAERVEDSRMKEIKGLGQRLEQLNKGLEMVKNKQVEQRCFSDKIVHQEQETLNTRDMRKLTDVCFGQCEDLKTLWTNHRQISDITRRFFEAKNELLENIRVRLQWVSDTHQIIHTADNKVLLRNERLRKLRRQLELLKQIHDSPIVYAVGVSETLRRKLFSQEFVEWSKLLVEKCRTLHAEESRVRESFSQKMDRHFLRCLFKGMDDKAPSFCLDYPPSFDTQLASIEIQHVREIRQCVPQLSTYLQLSKPQVFQRLSLAADISSLSATTISSQSMLKREASFLMQMSPRLSSANHISTSGRTLCQSPSWTSGDEFSPNPFVNFFPADSTRDGNILTNSEAEESGQQDNSLYDNNSLFINNGAATATTKIRSAPISIPVNSTLAPNRSDNDAPLSDSRHYSEKSSKFGTPGETLTDGNDETVDEEKELDEENKIKTIEKLAPIVRSLSDLMQLEETTVPRTKTVEFNRSRSVVNYENELNEKKKLLEESLLREDRLKRLLSETEARLRQVQRQSEIFDNVRNVCSEVNSSIKSIRSELDEFAILTRENTKISSKILLDSAKKLELNLQTSLAEARKATEMIQRAEFQPIVDEIRDELAKERQSHRESLKRLENCEAYLAQKDDVIELLQQRLDDNEGQFKLKLEETESELTKRLTIDHELELDKLRGEYRNELDAKENEIRYYQTELNDKNQMLKQMRRENDKLVMSMYERKIDNENEYGGVEPAVADIEFLRSNEEEFAKRLQLIKAELEKVFEEKLKTTVQDMEAKHAEEIERVKSDCDMETQLILMNNKSHPNSRRSFAPVDVTSPKSSSEALFSNKNTLCASSASIYCTILDENEKVDFENKTTTITAMNKSLTAQDDIEVANIGEEAEELKSPDSGNGPSTCMDLGQSTTVASFFVTTSNTAAADLSSSITMNRSTQTKFEHKVSILRVHKGDLVLLVFDHKTNSYVVFTVSPVLYILKETSIQRMGLQKLPAANTGTTTTAGVNRQMSESNTPNASSKTQWVLARLLDLDFCQIKKPSNRYNLPIGTKFYRVSAERCEVVYVGDGK